MHGVMGFGVLGLVFKLQKWDESALFFDGCSLGTLTLPMRILHNPAHVPPSDPIMAKLMNGLPSSHLDYSAALSCPVSFFVRASFRYIAAANIFSIGVYTGVTIPALRTIVTPLEGIDTREDQIEAAKVLSAGNTIIMVLLGSVLLMQVSSLLCLCFVLRSSLAEALVQNGTCPLSEALTPFLFCCCVCGLY